MKKKLLSLLLMITLIAGLVVPAYAATNALNVVSGKIQKGAGYTNGDIYANANYFDTTITSINTAATYTIAKGTATTNVSGSANLGDGVFWCTTSWGYNHGLGAGTYIVSYDLGGVYDISRVDVAEMNVSETRGISGVSVKAGATKDAMKDVSIASTSVVNGDSGIDATHHANARATVTKFASKVRDVQYVDITLTVTNAANLTEIMIFGDKALEPQNLTVLNAPVSGNGVFSNKYIYQNYLKTTLASANAGATYSWLPNAKSSEEATANDIVSGVNTRGSANLTNGAALWCTPGYNYQVDLQNPELTYTLRFDLKDWYDISRVDVFEVNYVESAGVITEGVTDYTVSVGTRADAMNAATIEKTETILGDSSISAEHKTGKGTMKTLATAMHGRYVDITFSVAGTAEIQGVMIFGEKPEKETLNSIGGPVISNSGIYGALDVYPQYLDANINMLSNVATYTFTSGSGNETRLSDGQVWFAPAWGSGVWMTDESTTYKVLYDLKNTFEVTRVDVHEIAGSKGNFAYNYIKSFAVSVGSTPDNLVPVEVNSSRVASWDKNGIVPSGAGRANIAELVTPTEGRYVEVAITVGSDACLGEILLFGNSVERTDYTLISPNALTETDLVWYKKDQKINITEAGADTTYQWAIFGLTEHDGSNKIAPLARKLDDDYNGDGLRGEKNIADGNITSSDAQYVVPLEGNGENVVIYDFGKKMAVSRVDVHEFVKNGTGLGTITVSYGDKLGAINKTAKSVTLEYSSEEELTHKLNAVDLGTPVETRFLAIAFSMNDGNDTTTNPTKYVLGDILIFGEEIEAKEYEVLKSLSGQVWDSANISYYNTHGFTVEAIDTGMTAEWATSAECALITKDTHSKPVENVLHGSFNTTATSDWFTNAVCGITFDFKAPRTISRVDLCYNENASNGYEAVSVYASNDKASLYNESNLVETFDMTRGENRGFWAVVSGSSVIAPLTLESEVEAQYIGVIFDNQTGVDSDNDSNLRQVVIFGEDNKFAPLQKAINEALAYDNSLPYDTESWGNLQSAIEYADYLMNTDATEGAIDEAIEMIKEAIFNLDLRGGTKLISQNKMENAEWVVFDERWPEIRQEILPNASARILSAEDGVTGVDPNIKNVDELFDGNIKMYSGNDGIWSGWGNHGTTYVLYDFGEEVWINGADVASYDYKYYNNAASKYIGEIFVEVSNDGVNFTPAGSAPAPEFTDDEIGPNLVRTAGVTFPAKKARYAKVGITKGAGTIQYVLMEMWIRGIADFTNKIEMTKEEDGNVIANVFMNSEEEGATLFLANYDRLGRLIGVEMSEQVELTDGYGELVVSSQIADGTVAKGMVFSYVDGLKPLLPAKVIDKYTEKEFTLSNMFTDGGVIQQGKEVPVFGTATTGTEIIVTVNDAEYETVADSDGKWIIYADAVEAFDEVIISVTDGESTFAAEMVGGEVWLLSGQSNMMYTFDLLGSRAELPTNVSNYPNFRFYNVPVVAADTEQTEINSEWVDVSTLDTEAIADLSALGILSGIEFSDTLGVPVGIILAARGGTSIEAFTSQEGFIGNTARFYNNFLASQFYNGMISPIVPYGIKGVLWYQGCQNHGNWQPDAYLDLQEAWVNDWRAKWNDDTLPFVITMLAPWKDGNFAHIRDQQLALRDMENDIGVVSIMDLGDMDGIVGDNIHPIEKKEVARRLVLTAQGVAYGDENAKYRFPVMKSLILKEDGSVDVVFDDVYDGLSVKEGDTTVTGFKLNVGGEYKDAVATITSIDTVNVKVEGVLAPNGVWYAYQGAINPELNLFNSEGLSAAPFYAEIN